MTRSRDVADTQDNLGGAVAPFVAGKNRLINGNFDIWQRGTSFTSVLDGTYLADRWRATQAGTTVNLSITQDTSVPNTNAKYSMKFQQITTGASAITEYAARQIIEQNNILPLLGKSCIVSFWYKSNKTGSHGIRIIGVNTGGTDQATTFTVNAADTWEYKTVAVTAFSGVSAANLSPTAAAGYVDIGFRVGGTGAGFTTLSANDYFQISQVQLEAGSVATPFTTASGSIGGELALCQRYFQRYSNSMPGRMSSIDVANRPEWQISYSTKRVAPTISVTNPTNITWVGMTIASSIASTAFLGTYSGTTTDEGLCFFSTASGISTYTIWSPEFGGTVYIDISAEL
jgi:hypothetical protein